MIVKDITMGKHFGQGNDTLAWFWCIGPSQEELTGEWMEECKPNLLIWIIFVLTDLLSLLCELASSKSSC